MKIVLQAPTIDVHFSWLHRLLSRQFNFFVSYYVGNSPHCPPLFPHTNSMQAPIQFGFTSSRKKQPHILLKLHFQLVIYCYCCGILSKQQTLQKHIFPQCDFDFPAFLGDSIMETPPSQDQWTSSC